MEPVSESKDTLKVDDNQDYVLEKLALFTLAYGPGLYDGDVEKLKSELAWFAQRLRLWTLSYRNTLVGLGTGIQLPSLDSIEHPKYWELEDDKGRFFYARLFVIHPIYKDYGILEAMVGMIHAQVPGFDRIFWTTRKGTTAVRKVSTFLKGVQNGI